MYKNDRPMPLNVIELRLSHTKLFHDVEIFLMARVQNYDIIYQRLAERRRV